MTHQEIVASVDTAKLASLPPYQRLCWILSDVRAATITADPALYQVVCFVHGRMSQFLGEYKRGKIAVEAVVEGVVSVIEEQRERALVA